MEEMQRAQMSMDHLEYLKKGVTMMMGQVEPAVLPVFFRWMEAKKAEFKCRKFMPSGFPSYQHSTNWDAGTHSTYRMSPDTTVQTEALELTKSPEKKMPQTEEASQPPHSQSYYRSHHDSIAYPKESAVPYKSHHSPVYGSEAGGIINLSVKSAHNDEANTNVATSPVLKVPSLYTANSPAKPVATSPPPPPPAVKSEKRKDDLEGYSNLRSLLTANKVSDLPVASSLCASPAKSSDAEASMPGSPDSKDGRKGQTECNICHKTFQYRSSYRRHMRIHQGVYTHICAACNRKFTRKEHFVRHKCNRKPNIPNRSANRVELTPEARLPADRVPQPKVAYPPTLDGTMAAAAAMYSPAKSVEENFISMALHPQPHVEHLPAAMCNNESRRKKTQPRKLIVKEALNSGNGYMDEEDEEVLKAYESPVHTPAGSESLHSNPASPQDLSMPPAKSAAVQNLSSFDNHEQPMETDHYAPVKPIVIAPEKGSAMDTISTTTGTYQIEQGNEQDRCIKVTKQSNYLKLRNEAQTVNGKTEFSCPVCSKVFFRSSNFSRHMRLHRGVFSYICKECNRGFYRREHFQKHKCTHRGMPTKCVAVESDVAIEQSKSDDNGNENMVPNDIPEGAEEGIDLGPMEDEEDLSESEEEEEGGNLVVDESAGLSEDEEDLNSPLPPPIVRN